VAFLTHHEMTYEAMRRIGYDAVTVGNHDEDAGRAALHRYEEVLGQSLLCLNLLKPDGTLEFPPSRIVQVGELKVGIIGLIIPRQEGSLDLEASGRALAREAERLRPQVHLIIALCHAGPKNCAIWSQLAPDVDVFVSGHTHELLPAPVVVPGTGARIVQAGSYARTIGRLDLLVDLERKKVIEATGEVVALKHDTVPPDAAMLSWVRQREEQLCPEASEVVMENAPLLTMPEVAWLGAEALRRQAHADIGFSHAGQIIRSPLFAGRVDVNAIFVAGGDRGNATVETELTGAEIIAYLEALAADKDNQTNWAGFKAAVRIGPGGIATVQTDLEPAKTYRVVMPALEWNTRFLRMVPKFHLDPGASLQARKFTAQASTASFTSAMQSYLRQLASSHQSPKELADRLAAAALQGPEPPGP
jgi:2',3'-cyclic-nucleotide 2'-phosphodiesterase (5'-nucleotidase family)